jgi:hypothetical protein
MKRKHLKKMNKASFFAVICLVVAIKIPAQEGITPAIRDIKVLSNDSLIVAQILISKVDNKLSKNHYYWYDNGNIRITQSGIFGYPLHGKYTVYDLEENILLSGSFETGLKNGEWKYWYKNGNLKRVETFKKGEMIAEPELFDINGKPIKKKFKLFRASQEEESTSSNSNKSIKQNNTDSVIVNTTKKNKKDSLDIVKKQTTRHE